MKSTLLTIVQGTPFRLKVNVQRRNLVGVLEPMNLTGCVITLQARHRIQDSKVLLSLSSTTSQIIINAIAGSFILQLTSVETAALVWGQLNGGGRAVYQCEIEPPNGETLRILNGVFILDPEVVR